ncbi:MAG: dienelactone hydrolase family protein, partial [Parvularculaceae bacterium]|nr:dienelactone hydrolase family protein [Parvularculaceae bacterium]
GLIANYYAPQGEGRHPGVLLLGGSEGGIGEGVVRIAKALVDEGYAVIVPSYFGAPGQNRRLEFVPIETFDKALGVLASRPEVDGARLGVVGGSKGAEAALIVATRHKELKAVVAAMPTSVVWQGIDWNFLKMMFDAPGSSWSLAGEPVPYLSVGRPEKWRGVIADVYIAGLQALDDHQQAIIPVESITAPILLICGEQDTLWPSCMMADQVRARAMERAGPPVTILRYEGAGHAVFGAPLDESSPNYEKLAVFGGDPADNNAARAQSMAAMTAYLRDALK